MVQVDNDNNELCGLEVVDPLSPLTRQAAEVEDVDIEVAILNFHFDTAF